MCYIAGMQRRKFQFPKELGLKKKNQWQRQGVAPVKWWSQRRRIYCFSQKNCVETSEQTAAHHAVLCLITSWKNYYSLIIGEMTPGSSGWHGGGIHKTTGKHFWDAKLQTAGHPRGVATLGLKTVVSKAVSSWLNKKTSKDSSHIWMG